MSKTVLIAGAGSGFGHDAAVQLAGRDPGLRAVPMGAGELAIIEHSIGLNIRPRLNHGK